MLSNYYQYYVFYVLRTALCCCYSFFDTSSILRRSKEIWMAWFYFSSCLLNGNLSSIPACYSKFDDIAFDLEIPS